MIAEVIFGKLVCRDRSSHGSKMEELSLTKYFDLGPNNITGEWGFCGGSIQCKGNKF